MNNKVRVQDDLYLYVNQEWIDGAVIPDDKPVTGGFSDLAEGVEKQLIEDFNKMSNGEIACPNEKMENAISLFNMIKDIKKRNEEGINPVLSTLEKIQKLDNLNLFNNALKELIYDSIPLPFAISVEANMKDTKHHSVMLTGPSVILPDTTYYKPEMAPQKEQLLAIWSNMVKQLLSYTSLSEEEQQKYIDDALKFDAIIATLVKSSEEWSEYTKMYNPMQLKKVSSLLKPIQFKKLMVELFGFELEEIIVAEPRFLKGFKTLFNEENFELYKHWAYINAYLNATAYLSEEIREIGSTYMKLLSGVAKLPNIEKQAYQVASNIYSEPVGLYYGEKYFGEDAKKDVVEMVKEIIATYKKRINTNDFLSESTKQKAIVKLDKIVIKMGYPDKIDELYDKLVFDKNDSLYQVIKSLNKIREKDSLEKLTKDVNREQWVMPGHMVNACYNPFTNDITFPAAILQAPFYSIKQTRSQNLGGIGAVIGHEISHAFDNNGANCDENGNLNNWWTKEDAKNFKARTKAMIKEFDGIELEWGKVNGNFVVSENIADNGGMAVTLEIMSRMENANYEEYFTNWARIWCMKARPEYLQLLLAIDVHSPAILRANMQPRNFEEWYKTFNVKKTDKMYIAPSKRVNIW